MSNSFKKHLLKGLLWLTYEVYPEIYTTWYEHWCPKVIVKFDQIKSNGIKIKGDIKKMELREGQQFKIRAALQTPHGHPASYEKGTAAWSVSGSAVSVIQDPDDELSALVEGIDGSNNEAVVLEFRADGDPDLGPDQKRDLVATLDIVCTQGEATVVTLVAGPIEDMPAEEAPEPEPAPAPAPEIPAPVDTAPPPTEAGATEAPTDAVPVTEEPADGGNG